MLTNFLESPEILNAPIERRADGRPVLGRRHGRALIGSAVLTRVRPGVVLVVCTVAAAILCLTVSQLGGPTAAYAVLSIGCSTPSCSRPSSP